MSENNIIKFYISNLFFQITSYIFPIIYVFLLPNILSTDSFSFFAVFLSYISILSIVIDFGLDLLTPKIIIERVKKDVSINDLIFTVLSFKLILSTFIAFCLFIFFFINNPNKLFFVIIMSISIIPKSLNFYWWFLGNLRISKYAYFTAATWISVFGIMFIFNNNKSYINLNSISICYLAVNSIIMMYGFSSIYKHYKHTKYKQYKFNFSLLRTAFPYFSSRISSSFYMSLGIPIFSFVGSNFDISVYSIGDQIYRFFQSLVSPFILSFYLQYESDKGMKKIYKYIIIIIFIIILGSLLLLLLRPFIQSLVAFNLVYVKVINYYPFYVLALIAHVLASFFGFPLSNIYKNSKFANYSIILSTIIYFIVILVLYITKLITIKNLISAMIITETFLFVIRSRYFMIFKKKYEVK